jgi:hypothetical protein
VRTPRATAASTDLLIAGLGAAAIAFAIAGQADTAATFFLSFLGVALLRVVGGPRVHLLPLAVALAAITAIGAVGAVADAGFWSPLAHFTGGLFIGIVLLPLARGPRERPRPPARRVLALAGMVLLLGIGWELGEIVADALLGTNLSPSLTDTILDLIADVAGATAAGAISLLDRRGGASPTHSPSR